MTKDESLIGRPLEEVYPRQFSHILAPQTIRGLLEGKENTIVRYVNHFHKWFKISAYSSDFGIFIRLEDTTREMISNRIMRLNQFSVNSAGEMVFWFKPSGHIIYANTASCNSLGFEKKELSSMMVGEIDSSFTDNNWAVFVEDLKMKGSMVYESSLRASNKSIIPVEVTCTYLVYHGEEYLIAFARDITERKRAEEALRENEERLRLAQQVARVGTFEWNIQTGVNKWTPELEAMYGLPGGGFPGTQEAWEQLVHPEDRPEAVRRVSEAIDKGDFEGEWRVVWPDGTVHWIHGRAYVFKDKIGKPLKLLGVNIDITERKLTAGGAAGERGAVP